MAANLTGDEFRAHTRELGRIRQQKFRANHPPSSQKGTKRSTKMVDKEMNDVKK